jgi:hypothetical protein
MLRIYSLLQNPGTKMQNQIKAEFHGLGDEQGMEVLALDI